MKINRFGAARLSFETAKKISAVLEQEQGKDILLLLAGGSAFAVYDAILPQWLSSYVTIAMTDDRFSHELDINNSHILQATDFYNECINNDVYFISTEVWGEEKPEDLAVRFEHGLRKWREEFPSGVVIGVFGVGEDGHTCGIIPEANKSATSKKLFTERFENTDKWVVGYTTERNQYRERITITNTFIKENVDHAVVYVSGEKKRKAIEKLVAASGEVSQTPARVLREFKDVEIFTDIT